MSFPKLGKYGIVQNPLLETPFVANNTEDDFTTNNNFLLMDGEFFLLMDGTHFLLMGT